MHQGNRAADCFMPSLEILRNAIFLKNFQRSEPGHLGFGTERTLCCYYLQAAILCFLGSGVPPEFNPAVELMLNMTTFPKTKQYLGCSFSYLFKKKISGTKCSSLRFPLYLLIASTFLCYLFFPYFLYHLIRNTSIFLQLNTAGPGITSVCSMSFHYNVDEMLQEVNSCLYQLTCGKYVLLYVVSLKIVAEPIDDVK